MTLPKKKKKTNKFIQPVGLKKNPAQIAINYLVMKRKCLI